MTVDTSGTVVGYDDYYPYGSVLNGRSYTSSADQRYKFTEKERDGSTGLDYFGARYYDSWRARWLQVDQLARKYPAWSSYNHCLADPISSFDPDGQFVVKGGVAQRYGIPRAIGQAMTETATQWVGLGSVLQRALSNDYAFRPNVSDYILQIAGFGIGKAMGAGAKDLCRLDQQAMKTLENAQNGMWNVATAMGYTENIHNISQDALIFKIAVSPETTYQLLDGKIVNLASGKAVTKTTIMYGEKNTAVQIYETEIDLNQDVIND